LARIRAFPGIREKSMNLLYPCSLNRTEIALFRQSVDLEAAVLFFRRIQAFALVADEYRQQNSFKRCKSLKELYIFASNPFCNDLYIFILYFSIFLFIFRGGQNP
jgi:hypothetical protein